MNNLKYTRQYQGLTQTELSKISGVHKWRISQAEGNIDNLSKQQKQSLADALKMPVEILLERAFTGHKEEFVHRKSRIGKVREVRDSSS